MALFLILPLVALAKPISQAELNIIELSPQEQVQHFAKIYGADIDLVNVVIECESQWNVKARGDGGRSFGIFQFQKPSFERMAKAFGEELDYYSYYDQIKLGVWALENGYGNEWTAYVAIKNGGKYSFYSKQLQKHFTVYCRL